MKRFLLLLTLLVTWIAPLQAIYVAWELTTNTGSDGFENANWWTDSTKYSYQFVYSTTELATAGDVVAAASGSNASSVFYGDYLMQGVTPGDQKNAIATWDGTTTDGTFINPSLTNGGWFYVVIFEAEANADGTVTGTPNYAVAGSQFTAYGDTTGYYQNAVGEEPTDVDYVDMTNWLAGGTIKGLPTPEPTTVTLLALGLAGLALRRKVR